MLVLVRRWRFAMLVKMGRRHCNGGDGVPSALCEFALMWFSIWGAHRMAFRPRYKHRGCQEVKIVCLAFQDCLLLSWVCLFQGGSLGQSYHCMRHNDAPVPRWLTHKNSFRRLCTFRAVIHEDGGNRSQEPSKELFRKTELWVDLILTKVDQTQVVLSLEVMVRWSQEGVIWMSMGGLLISMHLHASSLEHFAESCQRSML